ncbi:hypothetical protein [Streptomyces alboflavus]
MADQDLKEVARIVTESGQRLADELLAQTPLDWLRAAMGEKA